MAHAVHAPAPVNKWIVASTVVLASFVVVMDASIVNVAMPQMLGEFGVTLDAITWVAVAYSIAEIILVTMAAWCSVLVGRKRFYILSLSIFTTASVLCGLARSLEMMIAARVLQGLGGGGLVPVTQAIMLETFPEEERGMAMALYSMGVVVAPTVGPVLGGWLTDTYGWPWIFYVNVPVGILGVCLAAIVLHDPPYMQRQLVRIDVVGTVGRGARRQPARSEQHAAHSGDVSWLCVWHHTLWQSVHAAFVSAAAPGLLRTRLKSDTDAPHAHHVCHYAHCWTPVQLRRWPRTDRRWYGHDDTRIFSLGASDSGSGFSSALAWPTAYRGRDVMHVRYHVSDHHAHRAQAHADSCL